MYNHHDEIKKYIDQLEAENKELATFAKFVYEHIISMPHYGYELRGANLRKLKKEAKKLLER